MTARESASPGAWLRVAPHVLMREVGDELVMLDLRGERYFGLNEVGAKLMHLARDGVTEAQLVEDLLGEFDVGRAQLEEDVRRVAADLVAAGLLERVPRR